MVAPFGNSASIGGLAEVTGNSCVTGDCFCPIKSLRLPQLLRTVGKREEGMGQKTMNFHGTLHVGPDILKFGVPENVNTKSDEIHHKDDKKSSKRTQKRPKTFEMQSLNQIEDRQVVEYGSEEINSGAQRWHYDVGYGVESPAPVAGQHPEPTLTGVKATFSWDEGGDLKMELRTQMKGRNRFVYPSHIRSAISEILFDCDEAGLLNSVSVYSEYHMGDGQKYRASPNYRGKPWYDWVMMPNDLPAHVFCFVDLRELPEGQNGTRFSNAVYMIQEFVAPNIGDGRGTSEWDHPSDIFVPLVKVVNHNVTNKVENHLQLRPVDEIRGPAMVIPDLDNENNGAFFRVKSPSEWGDLFRNFLES